MKQLQQDISSPIERMESPIPQIFLNIGDLLVSGPFYNLFFSGLETHLNLPLNLWGVTGFQSNITSNDGSLFDPEPSSHDEKGVPMGSPRFHA